MEFSTLMKKYSIIEKVFLNVVLHMTEVKHLDNSQTHSIKMFFSWLECAHVSTCVLSLLIHL
jgi:hypothetical protein